MSSYRPKARREGLLTEEMEDEVLVYDGANHEAHCLNRVAAAVWQRCDGATPLPDLARRVSEALGTETSEDLVWHALGQLGDRRLLEEAPEDARRDLSLSRRELVERAALAAGLTLATIASIPVPAAAQIASYPPPSSDRALKEGFAPVDPAAILHGVLGLPLETWSYRGERARHLGPMAQDFAATFGLGDDDRRIHPVDAQGVALAAVQGLHALVQEQAARLAALEGETAALRAELCLLQATQPADRPAQR